MNSEQIKKLPWINVEDWSKLEPTTAGFCERRYASEFDVDNFVEHIFKEIAEKLNVSYEDILPILRKSNSAFYLLKSEIFRKYDGISIQSDKFNALKKLFRVPNTNVTTDELSERVEKLLDDFSSLSDEEKSMFFRHLNIY